MVSGGCDQWVGSGKVAPSQAGRARPRGGRQRPRCLLRGSGQRTNREEREKKETELKLTVSVNSIHSPTGTPATCGSPMTCWSSWVAICIALAVPGLRKEGGAKGNGTDITEGGEGVVEEGVRNSSRQQPNATLQTPSTPSSSLTGATLNQIRPDPDNRQQPQTHPHQPSSAPRSPPPESPAAQA